MIVRVRASSTNDDGEWIADDIEFDESLKGPVDSVGSDGFVAVVRRSMFQRKRDLMMD